MDLAVHTNSERLGLIPRLIGYLWAHATVSYSRGRPEIFCLTCSLPLEELDTSYSAGHLLSPIYYPESLTWRERFGQWYMGTVLHKNSLPHHCNRCGVALLEQ